MTVGVTVVCGPWVEGTAAVARRLALASLGTTVVRSAFAPEADAFRRAGVAVAEVEPEVAYRTPGCVCCAVRLDVVDVVGTLARRRVPPRHVVVEASPHDDPMCAAQTVLAEPGLRERVALDALVVTLHAPTLDTGPAVGDGGWAGPHADVVRVADRVVIGGTDVVPRRSVDVAASAIRAANPLAAVDLGVGRLRPSAVLGARAWAPQRLPARFHDLSPADVEPGRPAGGPGHVVLAVAGTLDQHGVEDWLRDLHARAATRLLRFEAILSLAGRPARWLATGTRTALRTEPGDVWGDQPRTSLVRLIGDDLDRDELQAGLVACRA